MRSTRFLARFSTCIAATAILGSVAVTSASAQRYVTPGTAAADGWNFNDGKPGTPPSIPTINGNMPSPGNDGSLQFNISNGTQQPDADYIFGSSVALNTLGAGFNLNMTSLTPLSDAPAGGGGLTIRLLLTGIGEIGNNTTTFGSLGYYDSSPDGNWDTDNLSLNNGNFFLRVSGMGANSGQASDNCTSTAGSFDDRRQTISTWQSTCTGGTTFNLSNAQIVGVEIGWGSFPGMSGPPINAYLASTSFSIGSNDINDVFTVTPQSATPEPGTLTLLATGLVSLGGIGARKRRNRSAAA